MISASSESVKRVNGFVRCCGAAWLCWLALGGCKPHAGSSCEAHEARCLDARRALVCDEGKLVETPCRGKAGCSTAQESTSCDISGNEPGDACSKADEGVAACRDPHSMIACHARRFESVPCRGPEGCQMLGDQATCDQSVAEMGEACSKEAAKACSADRSQVLSCTAGRMQALYACRGERQCSAQGGKLSCDQTLARLGDACDKGLGGHIACSEDKRALIACQDGRFVASEKCRPGTQCTVSGQSTSCQRR